MSEAQKRRSMIVTGGNNGLGFQCARFIGSEDPDAMAVLACRNVTAGIVAKAALKKEGIAAAGGPRLQCGTAGCRDAAANPRRLRDDVRRQPSRPFPVRQPAAARLPR